jgi:hypothetical protein
MHSSKSKTVAAPEAAIFARFLKRKEQLRITAESPSEFDKYLYKKGQLSAH